MPGKSSSSSGVAFLHRARAIADVRRAVSVFTARHENVREVWLFGSLARGSATPRTDADLLIVLDQDTRRQTDRIPEFLSSLDGLGRPADLIVLTEAEWRKSEGTSLYREVISRGIRLFPPS